MILQALNGYYRRMAEEGDDGIAPEGFEKKEIPFVVVLNRQGECVGLLDTREGDRKKKQARSFTVPKGVKKTSGIAANILWDTANYVLGIPKPDPKKDPEQLAEKAREQHHSFIDLIRERLPIKDEGVQSVLSWLESGHLSSLASYPVWEEISQTAPLVTFQLEGDTCLICQREAVRSAILGDTEIGRASCRERV